MEKKKKKNIHLIAVTDLMLVCPSLTPSHLQLTQNNIRDSISSLAKQSVNVIKPTSAGNPAVKVQMTGPFLLQPPPILRTELVYDQFPSEMLFL